MSSITRILAFSALLFAAGCPSEPGAKLCPTGILCPADMQCGAVEAVCLVNGCGNGFREVGEDCDDGNITEGDGCSAFCRNESCGNNVADPGELCDDGNATGGDGCSADCRSKETCGNGIRDTNEACDDSNLVNGDGCTGESVTVPDGMGGSMTSPGPCMSREICGNGIKDFQVGEVCDDSNMISGDGCNSDCRSGEGCGNGIVDPGEQCDDGDNDNNDRCRNDCKIAQCGDGVVETTGNRETCDPGNPLLPGPVETADCNIDCTTSSCGDGKVNQTDTEQCDNGIGQNSINNNCTDSCLLNICGDGKQDLQSPGTEACDDGNTNNFDGCSNACQSATCGNMTVDNGEQCDDGNVASDDACVDCKTATCGDGFVRALVEQCDPAPGNTMNGDGCSSTCRIEGCGNGILDPGEQCDDGDDRINDPTANDDACVGFCQNAECGDGFLRVGVEQCDDNNNVDGDLCSSTCRNEGCGNGTIDPGEMCDDGDNPPMGGDGCDVNCQLEDCGDGFVDVGEECDGSGAGVGGETALCNIDCTTRECGDGKINATAGEQCDAVDSMGNSLNAVNRDCLPISCRLNTCTDGNHNTLGPNRIETCDDGNQVATDGCNNTCQLASCGNGLIDPLEECDLGTANNNTGACTLGCKLARCGDAFTRTGVEECDAGVDNNAEGPCLSICRFARCGDGFIQDNAVVGSGPTTLTETCDNGQANGVSTCTYGAQACTVCNATCASVNITGNNTQTAWCGDGTLDGGFGEACDNGVNNGVTECPYNTSCNQCSTTCTVVTPTTRVCGDNRIDGPEACDFGGANLTTTLPTTCGYNMTCIQCAAGCTSTTTLAGPRCGDGLENGPAEQCDLGTLNTGSTACPYGQTSCTLCSQTCTNVTETTSFCGDSTVNGPAGQESCDFGSNNGGCIGGPPGYNQSCLSCSSMCVVSVAIGPFCGDTQITPTPPPSAGCNNGENQTNCPADCGTAGPCGNGALNGMEQCDDGNGTSNDGCTSCTIDSGYTCSNADLPSDCTANGPMAPGAPTGASAVAGDAQATVSFSAPGSNGGAAITMYTATSSPGGLTGSVGSVGPIVLSGLTNGVPYTFTVTATNSAGTGSPSAPSNSVTPAALRQLQVVHGGGTGKVTSDPVGVDCGTTCSAFYPNGTSVTLTAMPFAPATGVTWTGASGCTTSATCVVAMTADTVVTATFAP